MIFFMALSRRGVSTAPIGFFKSFSILLRKAALSLAFNLGVGAIGNAMFIVPFLFGIDY